MMVLFCYDMENTCTGDCNRFCFLWLILIYTELKELSVEFQTKGGCIVNIVNKRSGDNSCICYI